MSQASPTTSIFKSLRRQTVLTALCYIALGVFFVIRPTITVERILQVAAVILFVVGVARILGYFLGGPGTLFSGGLSSGVILAVVAAVVFFKTEPFMELLVVLLAIAVLLDGITKLQSSMDLARSKYKAWYILLILAAINIALGVVLLIDPFKSTEIFILVVGIFMIIGGAGDLASCVLCSKAMKALGKAE